MTSGIILRDVTDVTFGMTGTVVIEGIDVQGENAIIALPISSLQSLVPKLAKAITTYFLSTAAERPLNESPIPDCFVPVSDGHAFASSGTKEPALTLHTCAGTLRFHFAPEAAVKIGKDLAQIATAALPPALSERN